MMPDVFELPTLDRRRFCECCGYPSLFLPHDVDGSPEWETGATACDLCEWESTPLTREGEPREAKAGVPPTEASGRQRAVMYVKLTGADGQNAVVALVEIDPGFSRRVFLVADRRNGQPLNAVEGPWRAIIPDDQRHARWIRGLVAVTVSSVAP